MRTDPQSRFYFSKYKYLNYFTLKKYENEKPEGLS